MICAKCHSELLTVKYSKYNFYFFCGECGDKSSEFEVLFQIGEVCEDVDYDEPMEEW